MNLLQYIKSLFANNVYSKDFNPDDAKDVSLPHEMNQSCTFHIQIPCHEPRKDSTLFIQTRKHLVEDLDTPCWVCGSKENRQVHHSIIEWSLANATDWAKVKAEHPDFPDWNKVDPNNPETFMYFVDHPYQMMVLCQPHHTGTNKDGKGYGIHFVPKPIWEMQKYVKDDFNYIDKNGSKDLFSPNEVDDLDDLH
jgi:hypothetical protein